jgi:hypothetical protein
MILSGHNDNDNINNNNTNLFKSLDFLYAPAPDIQASVNYYTKVLDGELLWKIHDFGVWVACIGISNTGPYILLADHIKSHDPILIYRVENIDNVADDFTHEAGSTKRRLRYRLVHVTYSEILQITLLLSMKTDALK